MAAENKTEIETDFQSFLKQRNNKTNAVTQEAQRFVNLYRALNDFGTDFVDQYNAELKGVSDDVYTALQSLVAGQEVRQYLDFLRLKDKTGDGSEDQSEIKQTGWLPSAEQEQVSSVGGSSGGISVAEWNAFITEQNERFSKVVAELKEEQNKTLTRLMDQLSISLQNKAQEASKVAPKAPTPQYSEIIEEKK